MTMMTETEIKHKGLTLDEFNKTTGMFRDVAWTTIGDCIISTKCISSPFSLPFFETCVKYETTFASSTSTYVDAAAKHIEYIGRVLAHGPYLEEYADEYSDEQYYYIGTIRKTLDEFDEADLFTLALIA